VKEGKKEVKRVIKKNRVLFEDIDMIFSSPFLRALETAEILYKKYPSDSFELNSMLESGVSPETFVNSIDIKKDPKICFVGHEPHLSESVKLLLKSPELQLDLEKGGAVLLEGTTKDNLKLTQLIRP
jgi:phosphohistidine phosphatase SixA